MSLAPPPPPAAELAALALGAYDLSAAKLFQMASFVMLVYDHIITFSDEIETVWSRQWSGATVLFALNRYGTLLEIIPVIIAFNSPEWTNNKTACDNFVRFEGWGTTTMVAICELVMILRVYALWGRNNKVLILLMLCWCGQVALASFAMTHTSRAAFPPGFVGCILAGDGAPFIPFWAAPMVTDTAIFILTIIRTKRSRVGGAMPLIATFRRDGMLYFFAIFSANLINTMFFLFARADLKAIGASFSQLITSVMISRLVLSLRSVNSRTQVHTGGSGGYSSGNSRLKHGNTTWKAGTGSVSSASVQQRDLTSTFIGNLGDEIAVDDKHAAENSPYTLPVHRYDNDFELNSIMPIVTTQVYRSSR